MPVQSATSTPKSAPKNARPQSHASSGDTSLLRKFEVTEDNLRVRRSFIRLGDEERKLFVELIPWSNQVADAIGREFYDWQFDFAPTRAFFERHSREAGIPVSALRTALERTMSGYFKSVFEGARTTWGSSYFEHRLNVGLVHDRINLPFKWYIGAYVEMWRLFRQYLALEPIDAAKRIAIEDVFFRVINYDMQAVGDSFFMNTLQSLGLSIDSIQTSGGSDKTEHIDQVKASLATLLSQSSAIADGRLDDQILQQEIGGALGESFTRMSHSLTGVITETRQLSSNALEGDLTRRPKLDAFEGAWRELVKQTDDVLDVLRKSVTQMNEITGKLGGSARQLTEVSSQMASNAEETAAQSGMVSAASEEISKSVAVVATGSEEMLASIKEIARGSSDSANKARAAVEKAQSASSTMAKLGLSSTEIGKVVRLINSIAEQTNLLALNATIEAARAGSAGKGFAVVATEVKELARKTAEATQDIHDKVEAIQGDTKAAVTAIGQIGTMIQEVNQLADSIASAVEEQTATTHEISRNINEAARGTQEITKNIGGVAEAAKDTTQGAARTSTSARDLAGMSEELRALVSKFRV